MVVIRIVFIVLDVLPFGCSKGIVPVVVFKVGQLVFCRIHSVKPVVEDNVELPCDFACFKAQDLRSGG